MERQAFVQLGKDAPRTKVVARSIALLKKRTSWPREKQLLEEMAMAIRRCPDDIRDFLVSYTCLAYDRRAEQALLSPGTTILCQL